MICRSASITRCAYSMAISGDRKRTLASSKLSLSTLATYSGANGIKRSITTSYVVSGFSRTKTHMHLFTLRSRAPRGAASHLIAINDRDVVAGYLEDAAHYHGGHATALFSPSSETEVADVLGKASRVLPIGAQSSLTGGATPMGE